MLIQQGLAALLLLGVAAASGEPTAKWELTWAGILLPDSKATPGVVAIHDATRVCGIKWGRDHRHVSQAMKVRVCRAYGVMRGCPGPKWELDHVIPRELGGADDERNLFPQPIAEARLKDRLENFSHRAVCSGAMSLATAQSRMRTNWYKAYLDMTGGHP